MKKLRKILTVVFIIVIVLFFTVVLWMPKEKWPWQVGVAIQAWVLIAVLGTLWNYTKYSHSLRHKVPQAAEAPLSETRRKEILEHFSAWYCLENKQDPQKIREEIVEIYFSHDQLLVETFQDDMEVSEHEWEEWIKWIRSDTSTLALQELVKQRT